MTRSPAGAPVRYAALALVAAVLLVVVLRASSCSEPSPAAPATSSATSPAETRATVAADRGAAAAAVLLGQADVQGERADSLAALLAAERSRTSTYRVTLVSTRARLDSALVAAGVASGTVLVDTTPPETPPAFDPPASPLASGVLTLLAAERDAADRSIAQCEERAILAADVAEAQRARSVFALAAADSALAALSYQRLAYVEADRRATTSAQLATRRTRQRNVLAGVALVAGTCTVALTVLR